MLNCLVAAAAAAAAVVALLLLVLLLLLLLLVLLLLLLLLLLRVDNSSQQARLDVVLVIATSVMISNDIKPVVRLRSVHRERLRPLATLGIVNDHHAISRARHHLHVVAEVLI